MPGPGHSGEIPFVHMANVPRVGVVVVVTEDGKFSAKWKNHDEVRSGCGQGHIVMISDEDRLQKPMILCLFRTVRLLTTVAR